jgi:chromosome segregation ATPase
MAESMDGDVLGQVLQAVQGLSEQVKVLSGQVTELRAEVKELRAEVKELNDRVGRLEARMDKLEGRMDKLEGRMDKLEGRMDKQYDWLQRLGLEFTGTRDEVQQLRLELQQTRKDLGADMQAGRKQLREQVQTDLHLELGGVRTEMMLNSRQMHDRIDRNNDALHLMVSGMQRQTAERFEPVEQRLKALEAR